MQLDQVNFEKNKLQGVFKKLCNSTIKKNGNVTNYTLFFSIIPTEFNAFATFVWHNVKITIEDGQKSARVFLSASESS